MLATANSVSAMKRWRSVRFELKNDRNLIDIRDSPTVSENFFALAASFSVEGSFLVFPRATTFANGPANFALTCGLVNAASRMSSLPTLSLLTSRYRE